MQRSHIRHLKRISSKLSFTSKEGLVQRDQALMCIYKIYCFLEIKEMARGITVNIISHLFSSLKRSSEYQRPLCQAFQHLLSRNHCDCLGGGCCIITSILQIKCRVKLTFREQQRTWKSRVRIRWNPLLPSTMPKLPSRCWTNNLDGGRTRFTFHSACWGETQAEEKEGSHLFFLWRVEN